MKRKFNTSLLGARIRHNLIKRLFSPVINYLAKLRWAKLTGFLVALLIEQIQKRQEKNSVKCIHALILPKAGFTEDIKATFIGDKRFCVYALDRMIIKAIFKAFLPEEIDDNNYRSTDSNIEQKKTELRSFWIKTLKILFKILKVDVVLSGNFSYAAEQEFAGALSELGIPFVALHKECLKTPALEPFYQEIYKTRKNPFQGTKICVYNEIEKRIQEAAGITSPENIIITGMPRLDLIHHLRQQLFISENFSQKRPTILFLSFNIKAGLPIIGRKLPQHFEVLEEKLERLNFNRLARFCHLAMLKIARENPEIKVIIKTKGDFMSHKTLDTFFGKNFDCPQNLKVVNGGDLLEVLKESTVVCGFNSTALLEAIALNKPVIIPKFYEALNPEVSPYIIDLEDAVQYADSPEKLIEMLKKAALKRYNNEDLSVLSPSKQRLLKKWLGNSDAQAGHRVKKVIEEVVYKLDYKSNR